MDVNDLKKIRTNSIDCLSAWHVLHHIEDVKSVVVEIKRVLKPGGRLVIYEHDVINANQANLVEFQHRIFTMGFDTMTLTEHKKTFTKFRSRREWEKIIGMKVMKVFRPRSADFSYYAVFKNV